MLATLCLRAAIVAFLVQFVYVYDCRKKNGARIDNVAFSPQTGIKKVLGSTRELQARRRDQTLFPIELSLSEIETSAGHSFLGSVRDLTQRKVNN